MNNDWLDSFLVFSECMNFTRAAERLHISQPALHIKINKLSEYLETPLYLKVGRSLVLTDDGRKIQAFAREMHDRTLAMIDELRLGNESQTVILAAGSGAYLYLLGKGIAEFTEKYTNPLRLLTTDREQTIQSIESGSAHIGVTALTTASLNLKTTPLTEVGQVLVVASDHVLAKRKQVKVQNLSGLKLILPPVTHSHRQTVENALMSQKINWKLAVEANGWELMIQFSRMGMGATIVNACCNIPIGMTAIPIIDLPKVSYFIVERENSWESQGVSNLKKCLLDRSKDWKNRE